MVRSGGAPRFIDAGEPAVIGAVHDVGFCLPIDDRLVNHNLGHVAHRRQLVHGVEEHRFEDGTQASCPGLAMHCAVCDRTQRLLTELEQLILQLGDISEIVATES